MANSNTSRKALEAVAAQQVAAGSDFITTCEAIEAHLAAAGHFSNRVNPDADREHRATVVATDWLAARGVSEIAAMTHPGPLAEIIQ